MPVVVHALEQLDSTSQSFFQDFFSVSLLLILQLKAEIPSMMENVFSLSLSLSLSGFCFVFLLPS